MVKTLPWDKWKPVMTGDLPLVFENETDAYDCKEAQVASQKQVITYEEYREGLWDAE